MVNKKELLECGVKSDPLLSTEEKETSITFPTDKDHGIFYSEVGTTIKWFLSIEESEVEDYRTTDEGEICSMRGKIPKGIVKLQGNARKSNRESQMVAYGPNKQ